MDFRRHGIAVRCAFLCRFVVELQERRETQRAGRFTGSSPQEYVRSIVSRVQVRQSSQRSGRKKFPRKTLESAGATR